ASAAGASDGPGPASSTCSSGVCGVESGGAGGPGPPAAAAGAGGLEHRTGRLAPGLDADLLLVDGDPVRDVAALARVRLVVSRGREPVPA
ncbi:hypothetical protein ACWKWC_11820, partial [Geodermatophilus nigrescens]